MPEIIKKQREHLLQRLETLKVEIDENRLAQEMVYFAQKIDVSEELDRLLTHVAAVNKALKSTQCVGRRLDFLMQELNRESNTLSSKSVSSLTSELAVDLKILIEQMREQIQNIE
jgi:uncharacterized protein (TIGR00255 family)